MTMDRYTKVVLTVIALCLVWLCAMTAGRPIQAQQLTQTPTPLPGGVQPVVLVGWGSMDMQGQVALHLIKDGAVTRTDATLPMRADRPLPVTLPYTANEPLPTRVSSSADNPLPVQIASIRKNANTWDAVKTETLPAPTRDRPGGGHH